MLLGRVETVTAYNVVRMRVKPGRNEDYLEAHRAIDSARIADRFGVELHERTVGKYLAALGYRRLSVRPRHPKTDPEPQEAFKKASARP